MKTTLHILTGACVAGWALVIAWDSITPGGPSYGFAGMAVWVLVAVLSFVTGGVWIGTAFRNNPDQGVDFPPYAHYIRSMAITISHEYDPSLTEASSVEIINEVIAHCAKELGIKDAVIALDEEETVGASCSYDKEDGVVELNLNFKNTTFDFILLMLCHEMVHVKQFLDGTLVEKCANSSDWKGENFKHEDQLYVSLPWEKEAYGLEEKLFAGYLKGLV